MPPSSLTELRKFVSPEFVFGEGALCLAGRYAKNFGADRVLVVTDEGVRRAGWAGRVIECLQAEGIGHAIYSGVTPNTRAGQVMEGAEAYRREECDLIVAVGGGSVIDCAKGIGIVTVNGRDILEFAGVDLIPQPGPPLICVPTTCSGADLSQFTLITDPARKVKLAIVSKMLVPDTSLIDPQTTVTLSAEESTDTNLDVFIQSIEAYVSNASSPITDLLSLHALKLVADYFGPVIREPRNLHYREKMMMGSLQAGLAFTNASLGLAHAMSHAVGGLTDEPHGLSTAVLFPRVAEFNYEAVPDRFRKIAETAGLQLNGLGPGETKAAIIGWIERFIAQAGKPGRLRDLGITGGDIPVLARKALNDVFAVTNPRPASLEAVEAIYEKAL